MATPPSTFPPYHPRTLLQAYHGPGLFVTATGTDVGKTTVTAALAAALHSLHVRVGVCKPVASGCPKDPARGNDPAVPLANDDLLSPDAELAGRAAGLDPADEALLRAMSPLRYAAPTSPRLAAKIEERPPDWRRVAAALDYWQETADVLLVEGAGGWYVPLDEHDFMIADLAAALRLPVLVVTNAALGTLNQTLLTVHAIQQKNLPVVGLVINRVPAAGRRDIATDSNLEELPRITGVPVRAVLPEAAGGVGFPLPEAFVEALVPFAREWWGDDDAGGVRIGGYVGGRGIHDGPVGVT
jgi:dethiobiotin synthetase